MSKPKFDPSKPFEEVSVADNKAKPKFNPSQPFEEVQPQSNKQQEISAPMAYGSQLADTATFGLGDEILGGVGGIERGINYLRGKTMGDKGLLDAIKTGYVSDRNAARKLNEMAQEQHPIVSALGSATAVVPQLGARGAISLANLVGQGALQGFGSAEGDLSNQIQGAATGGLVGGALGKGAEVVGKVGSKALDKASKINKESILKALGAQKGEFRKLGSYGDDVAKYALEKGIVSANPFQSVESKIAKTEGLSELTGKALGKAREAVPAQSLDDILAAVNKSADFNPNLAINAPKRAQIEMAISDLQSLAKEGKVAPQDLTSYLKNLREATQKSLGEVSPAKEALEGARRSLATLENPFLGQAGTQAKADYSKLAKIQELLANKKAMAANQALPVLPTGVGAGIGSLLGGAPGGLVGAALGSPVVRSRILESGAVLSNQAIELAKRLNIDPKVAALLLQKMQVE